MAFAVPAWVGKHPFRLMFCRSWTASFSQSGFSSRSYVIAVDFVFDGNAKWVGGAQCLGSFGWDALVEWDSPLGWNLGLPGS